MDYKTDSEIIDDLGGTSKLAKKIGVRINTISTWRTRGIPWYGKMILAFMYRSKVPSDWRKPSETGVR